MKIEIEVSAASTKRVLVIAATLVVVGIAGVASAALPQFTAGEELTEGKLNGNFNALDGRVTALETGKPSVKVGTQAYSLGATYVGPGASTLGKIVLDSDTGYVAARKICQSIGTKSPTAHMCDGAELVRSAQLGVAIPVGWYSTGANAPDGDNVMFRVNDCRGWTSLANPADPTNLEYEGALWSNGPGNDVCKSAHPILCCD